MSSLKVLIADDFEKSGLDALTALGCDIHIDPKLKEQALVDASRQTRAEVLIVRSTLVPEAVLASPDLSLVVRAGAGVNNIDLAAASKHGVYVANCPGKNATAVAELAFGLLLSLDRRIPDNVSSLRQGAWNKKGFSEARGIKGRTLGIIGLGQIGKEVAAFAQAFGMRVVCWSRSLTAETASQLKITRCDKMEEVARLADAVSVHLALTKETRGLIGKSFFDAMQQGALFINTARCEVVDEAAMIDAVNAHHIRVGTDVPSNEPGASDKTYSGPLKDVDGVYVTHHIGASTDQAQQAVADETVRIVKVFMQTGEVPNCVNLRTTSRAKHFVTVRHEDCVGVLAEVLSVIRDAGVNVQEMQNIFFDGADTACAKIRIDKEATPELITALRGAKHVLNVTGH